MLRASSAIFAFAFVRPIVVAICTAIVGGAMNAQPLFGQSVDFTDGKSLPLANEANLLKSRELIRDKNWLPAARQMLEMIETSGDKLFLVDTSNQCRVFCDGVTRAHLQVCQWSNDAPEALSAFRDLIDAEAQTIFEQAQKARDINGLRVVARKYFSSSVGDAACNQLAAIEFEKGDFLSAARLWDALIRVEDFPSQSLVQYPDSSLSQLKLMTSSMSASLFASDFENASNKLKLLRRNYPDSKFDFLGKSELSVADLQQEFDAAKSEMNLPSKTRFADTTLNGWLDIRGRPSWTFPLEQQTNSKSPFWGLFPPVAEPTDQSLATFATIDRQKIYWNDTHHVYQVDGQFRGEASASLESKRIWSTPFPKEVSQTERKRLGRPVFDLEINDGKLFARMGDPRTSYRNDALTRNRSYLVGLDLAQDGTLLPGFPLENEDPRVEFDATPVHRQGYLYVSTRRTFRDNASAQITVQCLELSPSNRANRPRIVWERKLVSAESNNRGLWDEVSQSQLLLVDRQLICVGSGFVVSLDTGNGKVQWVCDYIRDRFGYTLEEQARTNGSREIVRKQDQIIFHEGSLYVAPSDSDFLFCISIATGRCRWKAEFSNVAHLLGVTESHLIASGHRLNWIDTKTGRLSARFPSASPDTPLGYGLPNYRGMGKGAIEGQYIYWPTLNNIFVLGTHLNQRQQNQTSEPVLFRIIDLNSRKTTGGNLHVENGIMLLTNEREIKSFTE